MSDRVRTGEILAVIGAVGLAVSLAFGAWFSYEVVLPGGQYSLSGGVGAKHLGWFAVIVTVLAAIAGLLAVVRVFTAPTTERPMLQLPIAFAAGLLALIVDGLRMLVFTPGVTIEPHGSLAQNLGVQTLHLDADIATGGWIGLLSLVLLVVGTWIAMADERTNAPAAVARTEALLATVETRPAPPVGAAAATTSTADPAVDDDAAASADDQIGDPTEPSTPSTEESA